MTLFAALAVTARVNGADWENTENRAYGNSFFRFQAPQGWMISDDYGKNCLTLTRDGPLLQSIVVGRRHVSEMVQKNRKSITADMMPHEIADAYIGNLQSNPKINHLHVLENRPVKIGGLLGFKADYTFEEGAGHKQRSITYGFVAGEYFYVIDYTGLQRVYFSRCLDEFTVLARSFTISR
jgi:hypothetical protein